jgi:hypothetical protein
LREDQQADFEDLGPSDNLPRLVVIGVDCAGRIGAEQVALVLEVVVKRVVE